MPFDRLVRTIDEWAGGDCGHKVFAQIGETSLRPSFIEFVRWLDPADYRTMVEKCSAIVSHAGMGSIITALEFGKPILVMPRRADLGETRNDHQVATAHKFLGMGKIDAAFEEHELTQKLNILASMRPSATIHSVASNELLNTLRRFIDDLR